jgi:hypothetical protein
MKTLLFSTVVAFSLGAAQPMSVSAKAHYPVNVTTCQPSRNVMVSGGGWTPGFYPGRPYYWSTVYGYSYYQPPVRSSNPTLSIDYTNTTDKPMKQIEFGLLANGNLVAEVKDVGTFSPGAEIKHQFGLTNSVFPINTGLARCVPLKIQFEDGTKWRNPHLPSLKHRLSE